MTFAAAKAKAKAKMKTKTKSTALVMKTKDIDDLVSRLSTMGLGDDSDDDADTPASGEPFRFFSLPYELRLRVYELLLLFPKTIDLDSANARSLAPFLRLFLVSRGMHAEASRVFYAGNTFRIFATHWRFFHIREPLLARLPPVYRSYMTKLELRLGPGWSAPPESWQVSSQLGLADATKVHLLKIFVECDPASHPVYEGYRNGEDMFTRFCVNLVRALFTKIPSIAKVEFDAYPSVSKTSPLLQALIDEMKAANKKILWGPERGWDKIVEVDLANVLQKMGLGAPSERSHEESSRSYTFAGTKYI